MSLRKWKNEFTKRRFLYVIKAVALDNLYQFNYTKKPYLVERKLPSGAMMCFYGNKKETFIAYDFANFKRTVGKFDFVGQYVHAVQYMAHEMRHYYQHRQIMALNPTEDKKTIESWKKNEVVKTRGMEKTDDYKYWFCSRELDANAYAYVFAMDNINTATLNPIRNKEHFNALKKVYKQNGGKKARKYFSNKIKKEI